MDDKLLIAGFVISLGLGSAAGVFGIARLALAQAPDHRLRDRLRDERPLTASIGTHRNNHLKRHVARFGEMLAGLFTSEEGGSVEALRKRLVMAGIYNPNAAKLVIAARVTLLFGGLLLGALVASSLEGDWFFGLAIGGICGYLAPRIWLSRRIRANHKLLERALPDGLDLLIVCVEAGLTVDVAMQRVSEELQLAHPALSRELSICHMETQVGVPRQQSLRNLGERAGYAPLKSLTAMLIQAERFGTSVASALRIQGDALRRTRQHRGEEAAAKAAVKLSFPLVLFIFPATFIVMLGPMIINFMYNGLFGD